MLNNNNINSNNNNQSPQLLPQTPTTLPLDHPSLYREFYANNSSIHMSNSSPTTYIPQTQHNMWNNNIVLPQTIMQSSGSGQWACTMQQPHQYYGQASSESSDGNFSQITQDHNMGMASNVVNFATSSGAINGGFVEENYHDDQTSSVMMMMMQQQQQQISGGNVGDIKGCHVDMGVDVNGVQMEPKYEGDVQSYYYYW